MLRIMHRLLFSRSGLDLVYKKFDMVERRKTFKIWLKRTRDRGGVEGTRLEAKDTKNIQGQRQSFRGQTLFRARTKVQLFFKKKIIIKIIRSSNLFFMRFKKKRSQIFFSGDFQKKVKKSPNKQGLSNNFSSDLQNFKDSKNTAVLQPKTGQFLRT